MKEGQKGHIRVIFEFLGSSERFWFWYQFLPFGQIFFRPWHCVTVFKRQENEQNE